MKLRTYLESLPMGDIIDIVADLFREGFDADEVREALPLIIDQLIVLPAPLEAIDGAVIKALVNALWPLFERKAKRRTAKATVSVS